MKTFWNTTGALKMLPQWEPNCWIQVTCPTEEDEMELERNIEKANADYKSMLVIETITVY